MLDPLKYLQTPKKLTYAVMRKLAILYPKPRRVLDAGAGEGQWGEAIKVVLPDCRLTGVDNYFGKLQHFYDYWYCEDFLQHDGRYDWCVGNPPFKLLMPFVQHGLALADIVAYVAPQATLSGVRRHKNWWYTEQDGVYVPKLAGKLDIVFNLVPRPSFTGDGKTDPRREFIVLVFSNNTQKTYPNIDWLKWK